MLHTNIKKLYVLLAMLSVGCIAGSILYYFKDHSSDLLVDNTDILQSRYPGPEHELCGFSFESHFHGKRLISIQADKLLIQKMKVGFFRFALAKEAVIYNAYINIYGIHEWIGNRVAASFASPLKNDLNKVTFENVFKESILPSSTLKRVSSIVMKPVTMVFHDDQKVLSRISARSAVIRYQNRDILFSGDVIVTSGVRVLKTGQLRMLLEKATLKIDRPFAIRTPEKQAKGDCLTTDICLGGFNL